MHTILSHADQHVGADNKSLFLLNILATKFFATTVTKQILFHNSVDFIGYPRQAYRGFLNLPKGFKILQVFSPVKLAQVKSEVGISCTSYLCQRDLIY